MNAIPIKPRKVTFDVSTVPRHWNGGGSVRARFFDVLSVHFPEGEWFFIQSGRHEDRIKEPGLREDIRHFTRQEGLHGIVHDRINEKMVRLDIYVDQVTGNLRRFIRSSQKHLPEKYQLAMTAAFEHFTATLGEAMLEEYVDVFGEANPVMRALFLWYGVEGAEHKAVVYDVYQTAVGGGYLMRASALVDTMSVLHLVAGPVFANMLRLDVAMRQPGSVLRGLNRIYGRTGILTRMLPEFLDGFRSGVHPWDTGKPEKVAAWLEEYGDHGKPLRASVAVYGTAPMSEVA
ncbi:putative metal-dependent hydrolase [Oleiphilus messinensis]|uniref:Putative metal-dependent hydrolase n=1 Tax=Oleiphilus messinensis TaxID=141451 RepID=A0A1Y0I4C8_9GAMM|nr:metal-dependent hydrolase [Oleiphilus messinensis]ARU55358.1 putative metal-dependent hydrolase [Oleiphilus messinensis]